MLASVGIKINKTAVPVFKVKLPLEMQGHEVR
jgi:hypothetical protein